MPEPLNVGDLFGDIDRLIDTAATTADQIDDARGKTLLSAVVDKLRIARKDLHEVVPAKLQELKALAEEKSARAEQLQGEFDKMHQEMAQRMEAMKTAAAAAKSPVSEAAPFVPDAALGARLRDELLRRFGPPSSEQAPFRPGKDIWEDWN